MSVLSPRKSAELIAKLAKDVFILPEGVKKLACEIAEGVRKKEINVIDGFLQCELHPQKADEAAVNWIFLIDTLNFCFWTERNLHWEVKWNGKVYTGYFALCAAVNRALQEGIPITDPKFYSEVTSAKLGEVLRSENPEVPVPLLEKRVACLHEVGKVLMEKYNGSFVTCLKKSNNSAQSLLKLIVEEFPCFKDEAEYQGHKVAIYKRAQILIGDIWACFRGQGLGHFDDIDTITMFADYRIPQVLIHFGALKYSDELTELLKSGKHLESGSDQEVEIRGCSIQAVELVTKEAKEVLKAAGEADLVNSIVVDHFLWDYRRKNAEMLESIPFHKTLGIYY